MKYSYKSFFVFFGASLAGISLAVIDSYFNKGVDSDIVFSSTLSTSFVMLFVAFITSIALCAHCNTVRMYKIMDRLYKKPEIMKVAPKRCVVKFEDTFEDKE